MMILWLFLSLHVLALYSALCYFYSPSGSCHMTEKMAMESHKLHPYTGVLKEVCCLFLNSHISNLREGSDWPYLGYELIP